MGWNHQLVIVCLAFCCVFVCFVIFIRRIPDFERHVWAIVCHNKCSICLHYAETFVQQKQEIKHLQISFANQMRDGKQRPGSFPKVWHCTLFNLIANQFAVDTLGNTDATCLDRYGSHQVIDRIKHGRTVVPIQLEKHLFVVCKSTHKPTTWQVKKVNEGSLDWMQFYHIVTCFFQSSSHLWRTTSAYNADEKNDRKRSNICKNDKCCWWKKSCTTWDV